MKGWGIAAIAGTLFALGLVVSGMTDPGRVTAFLDVTGRWDPTLAFVMAGAIAVHAPLARIVHVRATPLFDSTVHLPARIAVEPRLVLGAALFGVGWGLSGYCPGPALVSIGTAATPVLVFVAAMIGGIALARSAFR
ncbi:MAG: DUF6691 family protein [Kofleriaceae bacterium]